MYTTFVTEVTIFRNVLWKWSRIMCGWCFYHRPLLGLTALFPHNYFILFTKLNNINYSETIFTFVVPLNRFRYGAWEMFTISVLEKVLLDPIFIFTSILLFLFQATNIARIENDISNDTLEGSNLLARIERLTETITEFEVDIRMKNEIVSRCEAETIKRNATIERKQGVIDQLNKKIDQLLTQSGVSEPSPCRSGRLLCDQVHIPLYFLLLPQFFLSSGVAGMVLNISLPRCSVIPQFPYLF